MAPALRPRHRGEDRRCARGVRRLRRDHHRRDGRRPALERWWADLAKSAAARPAQRDAVGLGDPSGRRRAHRGVHALRRGLRHRGRRRVLAQGCARVRRDSRRGVAAGVTPSRARSALVVPALLTLAVVASAALVVSRALAAGALVMREGVHEGANYIISVPAQWNGGLVMFAHGYQGEGAGRGSVNASPLASHLSANGYAWAASGFRSRGYRPDWFIVDTLALRDLVI